MRLMRPGLLWSVKRDVAKATVPQIPIISRGLPFTASSAGGFGGGNAESNAIDSDYGTTWNSVFTPNDGSDEWYVLDMRGVSAGVKTSVWLIWKNWHGPTYQAAAALGPQPGSQFSGCPQNYKIQGHTSSGAQPALNDVGWVDLATVTNNRYNQRWHTGLNLSTYNWFRIRFSAANGVGGATDSIELQFDLRDVSVNSSDSIIFYGDSITWEAFNARKPGNLAWVTVGPIENALIAATGRSAPPICIDAGISGYDAPTGDTNKADYIGAYPNAKYCTLNFGSNDANLANIDLNTLGGTGSAYAINFQAKMQSMINYAVGLGMKCIIPKIPYGAINTWTAANVIILNQMIDNLYAANPVNVLRGPDLYSFFFAHQNCLRDNLHPSYDETNGASNFNGMSGYENLLSLWRDNLISLLY